MTSGPVADVPVWGIEVGRGKIRAVRAVRRGDDGFLLLDYREAEPGDESPEAIVSFLRKTGLRDHPLVIAIESPSAHLTSADLTEEESKQGADGLREILLEHVHQEPELIDLRFERRSDRTWTVCAEGRGHVEEYLLAMERAGLPAYALVSTLDVLVGAVRRTGLFEGDGILLRVKPRWTDVVFFDGDAVRHQGIPTGGDHLEEDGGAEALATDIKRLIDYHRTRSPREEPERLVLTGLDGPAAERLSALLPERPLPFPGDAGPVKGKGRLAGTGVSDLLRTSPGAVGAALAGCASPRRLDMAFHTLPEALPRPMRRVPIWTAAAALLCLGLGFLIYRVKTDTARITEALAELQQGRGPVAEGITKGTSETLRNLGGQARTALTVHAALEQLLGALPEAGQAPYRTEVLSVRVLPNGDTEARAAFLFPAAPEADPEGRRVESFVERVNAGGARAEPEMRPDGSRLVRVVLVAEDRR